MPTKTPSKNGKHSPRATRIRRDAVRAPVEQELSHGSLQSTLVDPETQQSEWKPLPPKYGVDTDEQGRPTKLNLGAGVTNYPGYLNVDDKLGTKVYPLDFIEDGTVEDIRASHILEHFGHQNVQPVLQNWVDKLQEGGRIRIAVPDFDWLAKAHIDGMPINVQGYIMGGQVDQYDVHGTIFNAELLRELMVACGLERINRWKSEDKDCASFPLSLNLEGYKPHVKDLVPTGITAYLSAPRFGPVMHFAVAARAFGKLGIHYDIGQGSMWHQVLCEQMERQIANPACEFLITCDYDTVFEAADVLGLWRLMRAYPEVDAIAPVQAKRGCKSALFAVLDDNDKHVRQMPMHKFVNTNITQVFSAHFGLTMFRASALREVERPWMVGIPHKETQRWQDDEYPTGKIDPDIHFWHQFRKSGKKLFLANKIRVGHLEEMIAWPKDEDYTPMFQYPKDYTNEGRPAEVSPC